MNNNYYKIYCKDNTSSSSLQKETLKGVFKEEENAEWFTGLMQSCGQSTRQEKAPLSNNELETTLLCNIKYDDESVIDELNEFSK